MRAAIISVGSPAFRFLVRQGQPSTQLPPHALAHLPVMVEEPLCHPALAQPHQQPYPLRHSVSVRLLWHRTRRQQEHSRLSRNLWLRNLWLRSLWLLWHSDGAAHWAVRRRRTPATHGPMTRVGASRRAGPNCYPCRPALCACTTPLSI